MSCIQSVEVSGQRCKTGLTCFAAVRLISDTQFFLRPDAIRGTLEFSANLLVSVNHHLRTLHAPQYTVDEAVFHQARPACRIVSVDASVSGDREALDEIAYQLMGHDVAISLPEGTDFETVEAIRRRLGYIVLPSAPIRRAAVERRPYRVADEAARRRFPQGRS